MTSTEHDLIIAGSKHKVSLLRAIDDQFLLVEFDGIPFEIFLSGEKIGRGLAVIDGIPFIVGKPFGGPFNYALLVNEKEVQVSFSRTVGGGGVQSHHFPLESPQVLPSQHLGGERVIAHMPGRIVAVKVKPSDRVKVGDPMFVLLAMKMENTLVAPTAGIVKEVYVEVGGSVNKGDFLALIE